MGRTEILNHLKSKITDINLKNSQSGDTLLIRGKKKFLILNISINRYSYL